MKKILPLTVTLLILSIVLAACGPFVQVSDGLKAPTVEPTTAAPTTASGGQGCTDSAAFVSDVTADNVLFSPNAPFTKTWRLKNTGTCTWDSHYLVYWISGATMSQQPGYFIVPDGQTVAPGQTVDVSVGMMAPPDAGVYTAYWGLKRPDGQPVPLSGVSGDSFFVKIRVEGPGASGLPGARIVKQSVDIELEQGSGAACSPGATYLVHAYVQADGPLSVLYELNSTAGQIAAGSFIDPQTGAEQPTVSGTVNFDASLFAADGAPTIMLPFRFVGPYPYPSDITIRFRVNGGEWVSANVQCP